MLETALISWTAERSALFQKALRRLAREFPSELDLDSFEQETLEVALDDFVLELIKHKLLKRRFSSERTFRSAFAALFGEASHVTKLAGKLQSSTSEYTDEFSPLAAKEAYESLVQASEKAINDSSICS